MPPVEAINIDLLSGEYAATAWPFTSNLFISSQFSIVPQSRPICHLGLAPHTRMLPSWLAVATERPSGANVVEAMAPLCPSRRHNSWPVPESNITATPFIVLATIFFPSGDVAMDVILDPSDPISFVVCWTAKRRAVSRSLMSNNRTSPFVVPNRKPWPLRRNATDDTVP